MYVRNYVALMILGAAAFLAACNSAEMKQSQVAVSNSPAPTHTLPPPNDGVRRITVPELQEMLAKNQAVVIDVRNDAAYAQGHIKGAKLIPFTDIQNHLNDLPKDKMIVTYCS